MEDMRLQALNEARQIVEKFGVQVASKSKISLFDCEKLKWAVDIIYKYNPDQEEEKLQFRIQDE